MISDEVGVIQRFPNTRDLTQKLIDRLALQPNLVDLKIAHLQQVEVAQAKFEAAKAAVSQSVKGLDDLLAASGAEFSELQKVLADNVSYPCKLFFVYI